MPYFSSPVDSTSLFYRDYRPDETAFRSDGTKLKDVSLVFLHGWPMSSVMWDHLLVPLCETHRFRCIAPDRRGFGNSDWNSASTTASIGYDTFVADLEGLLKHVGIKDFVLVGASMGAPESVYTYLASHFVREHCKGFVWVGGNMPFPVQSPEHPLSPSAELWQSILDGLRADRAQFISDSLPGIFALQEGNQVSQKTLERFERIVDAAHSIAIEKVCLILQKDSGKELRELAAVGKNVPILVVHGDADRGMPLEASAQLVKEMIPWADLRVYKKGGHGIYLTHNDQLIADLLDFLRKISEH